MKESDIKVSVIMPVYNSAMYLPGAVKMMQAQSEKNWELILIDDQSVDESEQIIKELQKSEPRIVYVKNKRNMGPSFSRNRGFEKSKGKWLAIVDADDAINSNRLEKMITCGENESLDIVGDNQKFIEAKSGKYIRTLLPVSCTSKLFYKVDIKTYFKSISKVSTTYTYGMVQPVLRNSFVKENNIRYNEEIRYGEDAVLLFDCMAKHATFGMLTEAMYTVRKLKKKGFKHAIFAYKNQLQLNSHFRKTIKEYEFDFLKSQLIKRRINMFLRLIKQLLYK